MGVDVNTDIEFPPDDTGHGFDDIGDVLTLPPMLLEKYLDAARTIVSEAVPMAAKVPAEHTIAPAGFRPKDSDPEKGKSTGNLSLSYYEPASVFKTVQIEHAGHYEVLLDLTANERFVDNQFDYNKCRLLFKADGQALLDQQYTREGGRQFHYQFTQSWTNGTHELSFHLEPLTPDQKQVRSLTLRIDSITLRGPMEEPYWVQPKNYERFFTKTPPQTPEERHQAARQILKRFVSKAYRRPVDDHTLERLTTLAERISSQPRKTFEEGVAQAMIAVLASPRFLFQVEQPEPAPGSAYPFVDEYSLASRLSYFLWSSMPDTELMRLAGARELRKNLLSQTQRMLEDPRSKAFIKNFTGQWLEARDIDNVVIDARAVLGRESVADPDLEARRKRFRELRDKSDEKTLTPAEKEELDKLRNSLFRGKAPRAELTGELRRAMHQETEDVFDYVLRQDRPLIELIDSDYTFLNERLAKHYGLPEVKGNDLRRVTLPADSPRGGVLTEGTVLAVTSNPTRTSPVKRGLFILDNILGLPPPPPPPDIPPLEDAGSQIKDHTPTLRETLALHRQKPLCASCHDRMDPLGLAFENFNALGMWRDQEKGQPIDATGTLITGEEFSSVTQLKHILAQKHAREFYRTLTEKMLTYALGRGLDYRDTETVDEIVAAIEKSGGRPSALLHGIIESAPFLKTELTNPEQARQAPSPIQKRADAKIYENTID
jgi:hypothetical protein